MAKTTNALETTSSRPASSRASDARSYRAGALGVNWWRTKKRCHDCPFNDHGEGLALRKSLARGRWKQIVDNLRSEGHFPCHNTVEYDDEGEAIRKSGVLCSGAIEWQVKNNGQPGQLARIMERLDSR